MVQIAGQQSIAELLSTSDPSFLESALYDDPLAQAFVDQRLQEFRLTDEERLHPIWQKVEEWARAALEHDRAMNDLDHDALATAKIRGSIERIKEFLALGADIPPLENEEEDPDQGY